MHAKTTLSAKGQVVIPKDVRDALGLRPGQSLDVIRTESGILLRPSVAKSGRSFEEITASLRTLYEHEGPPLSIGKMDRAVDEMFRKEWRSRD